MKKLRFRVAECLTPATWRVSNGACNRTKLTLFISICFKINPNSLNLIGLSWTWIVVFWERHLGATRICRHIWHILSGQPYYAHRSCVCLLQFVCYVPHCHTDFRQMLLPAVRTECTRLATLLYFFIIACFESDLGHHPSNFQNCVYESIWLALLHALQHALLFLQGSHDI